MSYRFGLAALGAAAVGAAAGRRNSQQRYFVRYYSPSWRKRGEGPSIMQVRAENPEQAIQLVKDSGEVDTSRPIEVIQPPSRGRRNSQVLYIRPIYGPTGVESLAIVRHNDPSVGPEDIVAKWDANVSAKEIQDYVKRSFADHKAKWGKPIREGRSARARGRRAAYAVVVGNIGTVYEGGNKREAQKAYLEYVRLSMSARGKASREPVYFFVDGEPVEEFSGSHLTLVPGGRRARGRRAPSSLFQAEAGTPGRPGYSKVEVFPWPKNPQKFVQVVTELDGDTTSRVERREGSDWNIARAMFTDEKIEGFQYSVLLDELGVSDILAQATEFEGRSRRARGRRNMSGFAVAEKLLAQTKPARQRGESRQEYSLRHLEAAEQEAHDSMSAKGGSPFTDQQLQAADHEIERRIEKLKKRIRR